jgi:membrane protease YdiL (CAAX protease family)
MKPENNISRNFIDLANMGRTDWQRVALTILLVKFLSILFVMISLIVAVSPTFFKHPFFHIPNAVRTVVLELAEAAASIFGFWLACKKILRRPFRSLISTDMTFHIRRCLLGAALYLPANALGLMAMSLFFSMRAGAWLVPFRHFEWQHHNEQIITSIGMLIVIPFLAFAEELFFRAWLTQTLRHYIRSSTITVVALVAVLFAAYHTQYDLREKMLMVVCSLGFSALSLRDGRLELAIGAHSMMNVCATLQSLFFTGPLPHAQVPSTMLDWCTLVILKGALPFVLMYVVLQKTSGWSVPTDARLTSPGKVQPEYL